jgi:hypothetical protein
MYICTHVAYVELGYVKAVHFKLFTRETNYSYRDPNNLDIINVDMDL